MEKVTKKNIIYTDAIRIVFNLEYEYGHLKWTITKLSELTKVSRNSIYLYLGSNKEEILKTSFTLFYREMIAIDKDNKDDDLAQRILKARKKFLKNPGAVGFYYSHALKNQEYVRIIEAIEYEYLAKLRQQLPSCDEETLMSFRVFLLGLVKYKDLSDSLLENLVNRFMKINFG